MKYLIFALGVNDGKKCEWTETRREFSDGQSGVAEGNQSLAEGAQLGAGIAEGLLVLLVDGPLRYQASQMLD